MAAELHPASPDSINDDILRTLAPPSLLYVLAVLLLGAIIACGVTAFLYMVYAGLGVTGMTHPVMWAVFITTFVFWVGIAHAGTLISAILYLFRAKWRNAVNRGAEAMTVFAVIVAAMFPLVHLGRAWRFYFILPYPNQRGLWTNFKSPLMWDVFAINTYMIISILFFIVGLIPDIAAARDRVRDWRRHLYRVLALGWRGSSEQWRAHSRAVLHLSGLATPLVLSVHSVVSWDFATSLVPGWHTTIFAPYFVAGAIFSGIAMVLTILIPVRQAFGLQAYLREVHFDNMGKLILLTSSIVGYAYGMEYFMAWYSANPYEQMSFWFRGFGHYWWATWTMIICNVIVPIPLWIKKVRTNLAWMWITSIFINIGMWFERFVIIVTSLSHEYDPAAWGYYRPTWVELTILVASFCIVFFLFMIFLRMFPVIAIQEVKELHYERERGGALMAQVLGILKTPSATAHAVHALKHAGFAELEVYSPSPSHEIEEALDRGPSIVRLYTLIGSLTGVTLAYLMQIWMAYDWPVVIGGKPFAAITAYTIIGFELNILFGGLATVGGLLIHGLWLTSRRDHGVYQPSFSGDEFGCLVDCGAEQVARAQEVLRDAGCAEVRVVSS